MADSWTNLKSVYIVGDCGSHTRSTAHRYWAIYVGTVLQRRWSNDFPSSVLNNYGVLANAVFILVVVEGGLIPPRQFVFPKRHQ